MDRYEISGGRRLTGEIHVQGAKNSVLPILAATVLTADRCVIHNCPRLTDVDAACNIRYGADDTDSSDIRLPCRLAAGKYFCGFQRPVASGNFRFIDRKNEILYCFFRPIAGPLRSGDYCISWRMSAGTAAD